MHWPGNSSGLAGKSFLVLAVFAALFGLLSKLNVALVLPLQSDSSEPALLFYDIFEKGNIFLSNWYLVHNCYLLSDFPVYALLGLLFGMSATTVKAGAFVIFSINCFLVFMILRRLINARAGFFAVLIMLGSGLVYSRSVMQPFSHVGTFMFALMSLVVFVYMVPAKSGRPGRISLLAASVLLFLLAFGAAFSDIYFVITFPVPLVLAYVMSGVVFRDRLLPLKSEVLIALSLIAGMMLGKAFHTIALVFFNLHLEQTSTSMSLIPVSTFWRNITFYWQSLSAILGISRESAGGADIIFDAVNGLLFLMSIAAVFIVPTRVRDRYGRFAVMYFVSLFCTVSAAFILLQKEYLIGLVRYLGPVVVAYAVLLGIFISTSAASSMGRTLRILVSILLCVSLANGIVKGVKYEEEDPYLAVAAYLRASGLEYGYAPFSESNVLTALTGGSTNVRPVVFDSAPPALSMQLWVSNPGWYDPSAFEGSTFVLLKGSTERDLKALSMLFGEPEWVGLVDEFSVYVWSYNIFRDVPMPESVKGSMK